MTLFSQVLSWVEGMPAWPIDGDDDDDDDTGNGPNGNGDGDAECGVVKDDDDALLLAAPKAPLMLRQKSAGTVELPTLS